MRRGWGEVKSEDLRKPPLNTLSHQTHPSLLAQAKVYLATHTLV